MGPPPANQETTLDYEKAVSHTVEIQAYDTDGDTDEIVIEIEVTNENDEKPTFIYNPLATITVVENTARGTQLGNSYEANDPDGFVVSYDLSGDHKKSFEISDSGVLMTLESLDYDRPVPCRICNVTVEATDGVDKLLMNVTISVAPAEDSVSTLSVTKANPVPGTSMGIASTALAGTKTSMGGINERPDVLHSISYIDPKQDNMEIFPAGPMKFVDSDWGNWRTVLRIEVTAQSPGPREDGVKDADDAIECGDGNQCVIINVNSDSAGDSLRLKAYRSSTQENRFVAAVELVEVDTQATPGEAAVYMHTDRSVAKLHVDEEDEIEIEFGNLRSSIDVENEGPEIDNFSPAHDMAFDDPDVEYVFTITDAHSGLPEPEDLPGR